MWQLAKTWHLLKNTLYFWTFWLNTYTMIVWKQSIAVLDNSYGKKRWNSHFSLNDTIHLNSNLI